MLTVSREAQLSADHTCIHTTPEIMTYSSPHSIDAQLYTTLVCIGATNQPEVSSSTGCGIKCLSLTVDSVQVINDSILALSI